MTQGRGLYIISVAAEILDMHPQTLRKYERAGFVVPPRTGTLRLYSDGDIAQLRLIKHFVENLGLNISGVELALRMTKKILGLRSHLISQSDPSGESREALQELDSTLAELGLRVVQEPTPEETAELPPPQGQPLQVLLGETVDFLPITRQASNK